MTLTYPQIGNFKNSFCDYARHCTSLQLPNCKKMPYAGQGHEHLVYIALSLLPNFCLHMFPLLSIGQQQSQDALHCVKLPFCGYFKIIL